MALCRAKMEDVVSDAPPSLTDKKLSEKSKEVSQQLEAVGAVATIASRDTYMVNLECVERSRSVVGTGESEATDAMSPGPWGPLSRRSSLPKGFVRVQSLSDPLVVAPQGLEWSQSRRMLEVLLINERGSSSLETEDDNKQHEERLEERLERLNLDMLDVVGDGNCQFRAVSNALYGSQDHHLRVRAAAVAHIRDHADEYINFLGEDLELYCAEMSKSGTWGDELTLRALCDSYGVIINVVTSDQHHWYLSYTPLERKMDREVFLAYIAPIHYNSIKRKSSLKTMSDKALRHMSNSLRLSLGRRNTKEAAIAEDEVGGRGYGSAPNSPGNRVPREKSS